MLLLLHKVLRKATKNSTTNSSQKPVSLLPTKVMSSKPTTKRTQQTAILLRHRRRTRIIVRSIRIRALLLELVVFWDLSLLAALLAHAVLVCLVCGKLVILAVLLLL